MKGGTGYIVYPVPTLNTKIFKSGAADILYPLPLPTLNIRILKSGDGYFVYPVQYSQHKNIEG